MPRGRLLPEQAALFRELVEGYEASGDRPEIRVGSEGRSGARVWIWGPRKHTQLPGRRRLGDFVELKAQGYLRQVKKDKTGTYFAITAEGLARHRGMVNAERAAESRRSATNAENGPVPRAITDARSRLTMLRTMADETKTAIDSVLEASIIVERFPDQVAGGLVVMSPNPYQWGRLSAEGQKRVGEARPVLDRWLEASAGVVNACAPERYEDLAEHEPLLRSVVERSTRGQGPPTRDLRKVHVEVREAVDAQLGVIEQLPQAQGSEEALFVPDTNALIYQPAMEQWNVGGAATIVVLPQVIAELDSKKQDPTIGSKADSLIRRFKEFDRRGDTLTGVKLAGAVRFREVAHDASFAGAPSWLSEGNADDRILVGALELAQRELTSRVILVTRDRNMQNKARRLQLAYVDAEAL
jgi:rRNA maturation endonuclease Nob1